MRVMNMVRYHWRRQRGIALFFALLMLAISTATLFYVRARYASNMLVFENGIAHVVEGYGSVDMSFNYVSLFKILLWGTAVSILRQERAFFVTASSSRWEFLSGLVLFCVAYAVVLTGLVYVIGVLNRLMLPIMGMRVRQDWSPGLILTGNYNPLRDLLLGFTGMLAAAGWASLIYALLARWWKQILVLCGIGAVVLIVLGVQVSLGAYTQNMVEAARALARWIEEVFIPNVVPVLQRWFQESRLWVLVLRDLAQFAVCFALVYPVILRMRVK